MDKLIFNKNLVFIVRFIQIIHILKINYRKYQIYNRFKMIIDSNKYISY